MIVPALFIVLDAIFLFLLGYDIYSNFEISYVVLLYALGRMVLSVVLIAYCVMGSDDEDQARDIFIILGMGPYSDVYTSRFSAWVVPGFGWWLVSLVTLIYLKIFSYKKVVITIPSKESEEIFPKHSLRHKRLYHKKSLVYIKTKDIMKYKIMGLDLDVKNSLIERIE